VCISGGVLVSLELDLGNFVVLDDRLVGVWLATSILATPIVIS